MSFEPLHFCGPEEPSSRIYRIVNGDQLTNVFPPQPCGPGRYESIVDEKLEQKLEAPPPKAFRKILEVFPILPDSGNKAEIGRSAA